MNSDPEMKSKWNAWVSSVLSLQLDEGVSAQSSSSVDDVRFDWIKS